MDTHEGRGSAKGQLFMAIWSADFGASLFCSFFFFFFCEMHCCSCDLSNSGTKLAKNEI